MSHALLGHRLAAVDHSTVKKRELLPAAGAAGLASTTGLTAASAASLTTALGGGLLATSRLLASLATSGLLAGRGSFLTASALAAHLTASAFLGGGLGRGRSGLLALAAAATSKRADSKAAKTDRQDHITKKLHGSLLGWSNTRLTASKTSPAAASYTRAATESDRLEDW